MISLQRDKSNQQATENTPMIQMSMMNTFLENTLLVSVKEEAHKRLKMANIKYTNSDNDLSGMDSGDEDFEDSLKSTILQKWFIKQDEAWKHVKSCQDFARKKFEILRQLRTEDILMMDLKISMYITAANNHVRLKPFPSHIVDESPEGLQVLVWLNSLIPPIQVLKQALSWRSYDQVDENVVNIVHWLMVQLRQPKLINLPSANFDSIFQRVEYAVNVKNPTYIVKIMVNNLSSNHLQWQASKGKKSTKFAFYATRVEHVHSLVHLGLYPFQKAAGPFGSGIYLTSDLQACLESCPPSWVWGKSVVGTQLQTVAVVEFIATHPRIVRYRDGKLYTSGILIGVALGAQSARRPRVASLPMPTSETIPYVAEVMGATSYEEVVEDDDSGKRQPSDPGPKRPPNDRRYTEGNKRVQRKLDLHSEVDKDLDPEYQEYQGVMGRPGVDFPVLPHIPRTEFSCRKIKKSGYYADLETGCQVFHICDGGRKISFLCPNGTIFRQSHLICDWWFRVDCERSVEQYDESAEQLAHDQMVYKKRAEEIARVMKTSTVPPATERISNFRGSRRKNERLTEELVDLNTANVNGFSSNQLSDVSAPAPTSYSETSQSFSSNNQPGITSKSRGPNAFESNNPPPISYSEQSSSFTGSQPPSTGSQAFTGQAAALTSGQAGISLSQTSFTGGQSPFTEGQPSYAFQGNPNSASPASPLFTQQANTQFLPQLNPQVIPVSANKANTFTGPYLQNGNPIGPQANFAQTLNTAGEQVYQQADADFKNLGLSSNNPQENSFPQTGNTNYKFSYTASTSSQIQRSPSGYVPTKDIFNNQVFSQQYPQEKERQVLAETASFASNRHRFGNQLEQGYYQANAYTATPVTPSTGSHPSSTIRNDASTNVNNFNSGPAHYQEKASNNNGVSSGFKTSSNVYNMGPTNKFYSQQIVQETVHTTQAPHTPKTVNRGSQTYQSSINQGSNEYQQGSNQFQQGNNQYQQGSSQYQAPAQSSTTTVVPVPTSSQVYNSHMQPYSSLNQIPGGNPWTTSVKSTAAASPTFPTAATDNYKGESSSQSFSSYNTVNSSLNPQTLKSLSQVKTQSSTAKPYRGKTIFTVKIKPDKDYSLLELYRVRPTNAPLSTTISSPPTQPPVTTGHPSSSATSASKWTTPNTQGSTLYTRNPIQTSTFINVPHHKYATVNITGTPEEIRPEVVNSLMDSGIKPTAANSLHTFASYYGSGETNDDSFEMFTKVQGHVSDVILNLGSTSTESEIPTTTVKPITSTNGNELPSELSKMTKDSYSFLFSQLKELQEQRDDLTPKESGSAISDLSKKTQKQAKLNAQKTTIKATQTTTVKPEEFTPKLRDSSELRELAQVFSRALSAYLEDPEAFKEILAQVRPTEPSLIDSTTPNLDDEVLDFSDASQSKTGTTEPPGTTIFNADDVTGDISIGQINNLVSSSKSIEADNSYETNSISPFVSLRASDVEFTTLSPSVSSDINSVPSASSDYYAKAGTVEDTSYFPTAGAVNDDSRPRYGGFQNNTRRLSNAYSPYGADLRDNITTGTPITESTTVSLPSTSYQPQTTTMLYSTLNIETTTLQPPSSILPAAQQVNSLVASHNLLYGTSAQFTSSSEEEYDGPISSNEQEKLLLTSGSQSLVSSQNYASFAENFNKNKQKLYGKDSYTNYAPSAIGEDPSAVGGDYTKGNYLPYFGQEPPFETISQPSAFQTQTPHFGDKILKNQTTSDFNTQASVNRYNIERQNLVLDDTKVMSDRIGTVLPFAGTENTAAYSVTWTVSPYENTQFVSSSASEVSSSIPVNTTSSVIKPTTYHPLKVSSSEATTVAAPHSESTTALPTTTVQETTTEVVWPTTMTPEMENNMMQKKAKEMFGMLNETAASMLMEVMAMAENNMTIRKLVLLLINDQSKDETAEQSRTNLINALLTHENDLEELTTPRPTTTTTTTTTAQLTTTPKKKVMKIMRVRSGSIRSLKLQRAIDSQTAVAGSNTIKTNVTDYNKANAAKLYIPSGPAVTSKPTTQRPPTTTHQLKLPYDSDARALELLKTLYNLAAKWG